MPVAVHVILAQDDEVLLLRRANTGYEDGNFSVIAGHLDGNEHVIQAAMREAKEEAGIDIRPDQLEIVGIMHRRLRAEPGNPERIDFFVKVTGWFGEIRNCEPEKCSELSWFPAGALPEHVIPYVRHGLARTFPPQGDAQLWFDMFGW